MRKELKFDDAKIHDGEEVKKIPNAGDVKKFIEKIQAVEEKIDQYTEDRKGLYADAKEQGIDPKALKIVIRHKKKPMDVELRQEVNEICEKAGEQTIFAFV